MIRILKSTAALFLLATAASAETYQATNWMGLNHVLNGVSFVKMNEDITRETAGAVEFEIYSNASLVPAATTLSAVGDGVAQLGIVAASYTPSDLPLSGMLNDLGFVTRDEFAAAFALTEIGVTNQRMRDEYAAHNTVLAGAYSTPLYYFFCANDVTDLASVKGRKVRTAGTAQNSWISSIDAIPVAVPMNDAYSGLERGSVDCVLADPTNLDTGVKLQEVIKTITKLEQGATTGATYVWNADFWKDIGAENRRKILDVTGVNLARAQVAYYIGTAQGFESAEKLGIRFNEPAADLIAARDAFSEKYLANIADSTVKARGIEDPSDVAEAYIALVAKWEKLLEGVDRTDAGAIGKIVHEQIFAPLDAATFGVK